MVRSGGSLPFLNGLTFALPFLQPLLFNRVLFAVVFLLNVAKALAPHIFYFALNRMYPPVRAPVLVPFPFLSFSLSRESLCVPLFSVLKSITNGFSTACGTKLSKTREGLKEKVFLSFYSLSEYKGHINIVLK